MFLAGELMEEHGSWLISTTFSTVCGKGLFFRVRMGDNFYFYHNCVGAHGKAPVAGEGRIAMRRKEGALPCAPTIDWVSYVGI